MYREAGTRRSVYFNPKCPHSVLTTQSSVDSSSCSSKSRVNKAISAHKCKLMLENWDQTMGRLK